MEADCGPNWDLIKDDLKKMIDEWMAWQFANWELPSVFGPSLRTLLPEKAIGIPILAIIGEEDSAGSQSSSQELLRLVPAASCIYLVEAGHHSSMETPEAFTQGLLNFWLTKLD